MEKVSQRKINKTVKPKSNNNYFDVNSITFENNNMFLDVDGKKYIIPLSAVSKKLLNASDKERNAFKIICSGYGVTWPLIDEDLAINGLIKSSK